MTQAPISLLQNTKLQLAIEQARKQYGNRDILTRSQAALADLVAEMVELEGEQEKIIQQRDHTASNIIDLTLLHERYCDQADDIQALVAAKRDAIRALEAAGVKLPVDDKKETTASIENIPPATVPEMSEQLRNSIAPKGGLQ